MSVKFKKRSVRWGVSNLFRILAKKIGEEISEHAAQLKSVPPISAKNISVSMLTVKTGIKKYNRCPVENPKIENFFANNSPKRICWWLKVWNMIDLKPVLVFLQKIA